MPPVGPRTTDTAAWDGGAMAKTTLEPGAPTMSEVMSAADRSVIGVEALRILFDFAMTAGDDEAVLKGSQVSCQHQLLSTVEI